MSKRIALAHFALLPSIAVAEVKQEEPIKYLGAKFGTGKFYNPQIAQNKQREKDIRNGVWRY